MKYTGQRPVPTFCASARCPATSAEGNRIR
ncbi:MAG: hypothetical protein ACI8Y8_000985, partial [Planctomycetota bacterium]